MDKIQRTFRVVVPRLLMVTERHSLRQGTWFHVMNRGIARRPLFDRQEDFRHCRLLIAKAIRRSKVKIHSWCLMTNHVHMAVESSEPGISRLMHRIESPYARAYNKRHGRDGPLFCSRFTACAIQSAAHWSNVIRYIDHNPVDAGMAEFAGDYPHASAWAYQKLTWSPPWMTRDVVETYACKQVGAAKFSPEVYREAFPPPTSQSAHAIETALREATSPRRGDHIERLPEHVQKFFALATIAADGSFTRRVHAHPDELEAALQSVRATTAGGLPQLTRSDPWEDMLVAALYYHSSFSSAAIGRRQGSSRQRVYRAVQRHADALARCPAYGQCYARVITIAQTDLRTDEPPPRSPEESVTPGDDN